MRYLDRERKYDDLVLASDGCPAPESSSVWCQLVSPVTTDIGNPCVDDGSTAMCAAWTAYFRTTGDRLKRPEEERTIENREIAFSFAAWRVVKGSFPDHLKEAQLAQMVAPFFGSLNGCRIGDKTLDVTTSQGIGNPSAKLVVECRRDDGSNPDKNSDCTGYQPVLQGFLYKGVQPGLIDTSPKRVIVSSSQSYTYHFTRSDTHEKEPRRANDRGRWGTAFGSPMEPPCLRRYLPCQVAPDPGGEDIGHGAYCDV